MAISLISKPATWARVWDTNRMTYQFSSTNYTQPNFQYQFVLAYWDASMVYHNIGTFNLYPNVSGTVEFNPSAIYRNYLSYNYNASTTSLEECLNATGKFVLVCYEYYGTPPTQKSAGSWNGEGGLVQALKVYNGAQQFIPYDYIALNTLGNSKWVMSGVTSGQFLTDATEYRLSNNDLGFLYFNGDNANGRPDKIRYQIYYNDYGNGADPDSLGIGKTLYSDPNLDQPTSKGNPFYNLDFDGNEPGPGPWTGVSMATVYDTNVSYSEQHTLQYYFPMGPRQLISTTILSTYSDNWIFYKVDIMTGTTILNKSPFIVYNTCKSNKFGRWQLSWLNPHGGFDCYTFDRKSDVNYKLKKDTYKQKLPPNPSFSTYDAGERVFKSNVEQEITLRSNNLTQKESQLLIQLTQSSRVYVNTIYEYNGATYPYGVPVIVTTDSIKYEQKKNDKEIFMEIKIRYANENIVQND